MTGGAGRGGAAGSAAGASGTAGGAAGTTGAAGRGGTTGSAGRGGSGGAGGGGCAAQMTPTTFYRGPYGPADYGSTSARYYFVEQTTPLAKIRYVTGAAPEATPPKHMFEFDASGPAPWRFAASEQLVAATWGVDTKIAVYGPDETSIQMRATVTLGRSYGMTIEGATVFYSHDPMGGNPTPGIYQWSPATEPTASLFASYTALGGIWTLGHILRATPNKLLFCDTTDVRVVDRATKTPVQLLFDNPGNKAVVDIRLARPRPLEAGVLVSLQDTTYFETGRDFYVDLSRVGSAPVDLATKADALADASACGTAAHYNGVGILFNRRYVYEGNTGLFAADVDATGNLSNLVRLTAIPLRYPEVTGDGDLFAGWVYNVSQWDHYRVGRL